MLLQEKKLHNLNWPCIPNHPYSIPMARVAGLGKTTPLLNVINHQFDNDKIYLYAEGPHEAKF